MNSDLYFECHVTIDPVSGDKLDLLKHLSAAMGFKVADFVMTDLIPKAFTSSRQKNYGVACVQVANFIQILKQNGFKVLRYKIEDTIMDSKIHDELGLLP